MIPPDHGVDELAATMTEHAVVIAGGGPTGLMLAGELALADIDVVIVERRVTQELDGSAGGLHPRTIEVLDQRGIAERFISAGQQHPVAGFAYIQLDVSDFPATTTCWRSGSATSSASWRGGSTSSESQRFGARRWSASHRTAAALTSNWPVAGRCERTTSSGATAAAA